MHYYMRYSKYLGVVNGKPKYQTVYLHRMLFDNLTSKDRIDHINHNTLDNRRENLRVVAHKENVKNRTTKNANNSSGYRNVSIVRGKPIVQLQDQNGKNCVWRDFETVEDAAVFAERKRIELYGEYAGDE
jgi:hypothetical protein